MYWIWPICLESCLTFCRLWNGRVNYKFKSWVLCLLNYERVQQCKEGNGVIQISTNNVRHYSVASVYGTSQRGAKSFFFLSVCQRHWEREDGNRIEAFFQIKPIHFLVNKNKPYKSCVCTARPVPTWELFPIYGSPAAPLSAPTATPHPHTHHTYPLPWIENVCIYLHHSSGLFLLTSDGSEPMLTRLKFSFTIKPFGV